MEVPGQLLNYMRKHNITPFPRTEEQRRQIQAQMSLRNQSMNPGQIPPYFLEKKEKFLQQVAAMGFDLFSCQDWLEQRGLYEAQLDVFLNAMQNPNFVNVLRAPIM